MISELEKYLQTTPLDSLLGEWESLVGYSKNSPTRKELISEWYCYGSTEKIKIEKKDNYIKINLKEDSKFMGSFFMCKI